MGTLGSEMQRWGLWRTKKEPYLAQVQGDVDLVVLQAAGQWWALPPALCAVDSIAHGVRLVAVGGCADVTVLALGGRSSQVVEKGWGCLSRHSLSRSHTPTWGLARHPRLFCVYCAPDSGDAAPVRGGHIHRGETESGEERDPQLAYLFIYLLS